MLSFEFKLFKWIYNIIPKDETFINIIRIMVESSIKFKFVQNYLGNHTFPCDIFIMEIPGTTVDISGFATLSSYSF